MTGAILDPTHVHGPPASDTDRTVIIQVIDVRLRSSFIITTTADVEARINILDTPLEILPTTN